VAGDCDVPLESQSDKILIFLLTVDMSKGYMASSRLLSESNFGGPTPHSDNNRRKYSFVVRIYKCSVALNIFS
jgi:hypothetical protein